MLDLAAIVSILKRIVWAILRPFARPLLRRADRRIDALDRRVDEVNHLAVRVDRHLPLVENAIKSQNAELRGAARERLEVRAELERLRADLECTQRQLNALRAGSRPASAVGEAATEVPATPPVPPISSTLRVAQRGELRLNFHCGSPDAPDHVDIDLRDWNGHDVAVRVRGLEFGPSSAIEVRASLALERFSVTELRGVLLPYWHSLLAPGGRFVAVSIDAEANLSDHRAGRLTFDELAAALSFGPSEQSSTPRRSMLSEDLLTRLLDEAGFESVHTAARWRAEDGSNRIEFRAQRGESERTPGEVSSRSGSRA
jgi:hypothetical protein